MTPWHKGFTLKYNGSDGETSLKDADGNEVGEIARLLIEFGGGSPVPTMCVTLLDGTVESIIPEDKKKWSVHVAAISGALRNCLESLPEK